MSARTRGRDAIHRQLYEEDPLGAQHPIGASHPARRRGNNPAPARVPNQQEEYPEDEYDYDVEEYEEYEEDVEGSENEQVDEIDDEIERRNLHGRNHREHGDHRFPPLSPQQSRAKKVAASRNARREPQQQQQEPAKTSSRNAVLFVIIFLFVAAAAVPKILSSTGYGNCSNGFQLKTTAHLRQELDQQYDFPPTFDSLEFSSLFQNRISTKPTLVHVVGTSDLPLRRLTSWISKNQPCAGAKIISSDAGDFVQHISALAERYKQADRGSTDSCRVVLTITMKNSHFPRRNFEYLESVVDDTIALVYTQSGSIPTNDWCVILEDTWDGDYLKRVEAWDSEIGPSAVSERIREYTHSSWSDRFYQRIQGIFFVGK